MQKVIKAIKECVASKTCCEEAGVNCNQGRDCPVREGTQKPAEAVHQIQEPAVAVPDGWKLVPVDPTEQMEQAAADYLGACVKAWGLWKAMIASAPECAALSVTPAQEVVLPEPDAKSNGAMIVWSRSKGVPPIDADLYTAESVRALLATGGQAQADMPDSFREWFAQNYPADTIIVDPDWHVKSIFRMAQAHARLAAPQAQADARDAVIADLSAALDMFVGIDALHSLCEQEPMDAMGRVKGTWSKAAEVNARATIKAHRAAIAAAKGE